MHHPNEPQVWSAWSVATAAWLTFPVRSSQSPAVVRRAAIACCYPAPSFARAPPIQHAARLARIRTDARGDQMNKPRRASRSPAPVHVPPPRACPIRLPFSSLADPSQRHAVCACHLCTHWGAKRSRLADGEGRCEASESKIIPPPSCSVYWVIVASHDAGLPNA